MAKRITCITLAAVMLALVVLYMSGCSLIWLSVLDKSLSDVETAELPVILYDEDGKPNYEKIEYKRTIATPNDEFNGLSPEVIDAYWKYYRVGDGILGPSSCHVCGFYIVSNDKIEEIESMFVFEETEIVFPKGIDPEITGLGNFKWGYSKEFSRWATSAWIGEAYYDMNNKIIYWDAWDS
ncbi:MAG: hypothetical protein IJA52_02105 [Clostridia bacterium]|nr:hypothetical protein [Clostridia bacterium]